MATSSPTSDRRTSRAATPGDRLDAAKMPGHWLLARMGKRALRPGGRALTDAMLAALAIGSTDDVVELAPGLGATTRIALQAGPSSYTAVERDEEAARHVRDLLAGDRHTCRVGTAQATGLEGASATVVFGEAFLTMQSDDHKRRIVSEAFRLLRPGGRYGLHEMCLRPDTLAAGEQDRVRGELSRSIHVGARPLTVADWRSLLEGAGFEITGQAVAPMGLLHPRRLIADEGASRAARIAVNVLRDRDARRRVGAMRAMFNRNADQLGAIMLTAVRPPHQDECQV